MKLFKNNIQHDKRVSKIAFKLDIKETIVEETIDIMYDYIKNKLNSVELEDKSIILNEEEFNKKFPTIHIPSLGYILPNYRKYKHIMKNKIKKDERENKHKNKE